MALPKSISQFTWNAYQIISSTSGDLVFSPLSAHVGLTALQEGALVKTLSELKQVLCIDDVLSCEEYQNILTQLINYKHIEIKLASKIYGKDGCKFQGQFEEIMKSLCTEFESIDFSSNVEASRIINQWIDTRTNGKISTAILPTDIGQDTLLILINTLYFKAKWLNKFNPVATRTVPFYITENKNTDIQMMYSRKMFSYVKDHALDAKIVALPYTDTQFEMMIFLPNNKAGIEALGNQLKDVDLVKLKGSMYRAEVMVGLPKFHIVQETDLKQLIKEMGCESLFVPGICNLSKMLQNIDNVFISKAVQKIVIDVSEEGTEAAAFTGYVSRKYASLHTKRRYFIADHPFIILITYQVENDLIPLFIGRIMHPKSLNSTEAPRGSPVRESPASSEDEGEEHQNEGNK